MGINSKIFVQFEKNNSSLKFQKSLNSWCKKKYSDRKYKTNRMELDSPLILEVWRVE
jgi:hypothetical protein